MFRSTLILRVSLHTLLVWDPPDFVGPLLVALPSAMRGFAPDRSAGSLPFPGSLAVMVRGTESPVPLQISGRQAAYDPFGAPFGSLHRRQSFGHPYPLRGPPSGGPPRRIGVSSVHVLTPH